MFEMYEEYKKTNPDEAKNIFPMLPSPSTKVGWDDAKMTPQDLSAYQQRVGTLRAIYAENYINSEEFKSAALDERIQKLTGMYSKARRMAEAEMFSWSDFKDTNPQEFKSMLDNEALPMPYMGKKLIDHKLTPEEIRDINDSALKYYSEKVIPMLSETSREELDDMKKPVERKDRDGNIIQLDSKFVIKLNAIWRGSVQRAQKDMLEVLKEKK